jgi:hypothetical protein
MRLTAAVAVMERKHLRRPIRGWSLMFGGPKVPIWGAGWVPKLVTRAGYLAYYIKPES